MREFKDQEILMICYFFPPIKSVAVLRSYYLHLELKKYFSKVHVLSTRNSRFMTIEELPVKADSITLLPTFDYRTIMNLWHPGQTHYSEEKKQGWIRWLIYLNYSFPFNLLLGEGGLLYILTGFWQAARIVRKHKIQYVYSSFMPYSDHVIAHLVKRFFPNVVWIADFRDLHVDPIYQHIFFEGFQHWCNKKILSPADIVTTVSRGLAGQLKRYHPRVEVLRNGIGQLSNFGRGDESSRPSKFTITYTGSMYGEERDPSLLFDVIASLTKKGTIAADKIQLRYAGKDGVTWNRFVQKYSLEHLSEEKGLLPLSNALQLQKTTHLNLLLSSSHPALTGVLTGKFYEYLASGNPVILILNGSKDTEFESLFDELGAGLVVYNRPEDQGTLEHYVSKCYREWLKSGHLKHNIPAEKLAPYCWDFIALNFLKLLPIQNQTI